MSLDLNAIKERREAAYEWVFAMCLGKTRFKMSIPYEETDTDAILCAALKDSENLAAEVVELREALEALLNANNRGVYDAAFRREAVAQAEALVAPGLSDAEREARALAAIYRRYEQEAGQ